METKARTRKGRATWPAPTPRKPHPEQARFISSPAKRKIIRAGRRGGKTVGIAIAAVQAFRAGRRVLYATPTSEQIDRFWFEIKQALARAIDGGLLYKNETEHVVEWPGTEARIRAKTAWNADTLRGDYADLLILDEYQLMNEDAWELVGAPMLLDNNGDAVFIYTPPSQRTASTSKARDKLHAAKLYKQHANDSTGRWAVFHFSSHANPYLSQEGLAEITQDMTRVGYEREIMAIDKDDVPGALWTSELIEHGRLAVFPDLARIVVALDPSATGDSTSDEAGIIVAGVAQCSCKVAEGGKPETHAFVLDDSTLRGSPDKWASTVVALYRAFKADRVVAEDNNGGEMVEQLIHVVDRYIPVKRLHASRGKYARAEPISAHYEKGRVHHVKWFTELEGELTGWVPNGGQRSPNRLDALVWALTELLPQGADAGESLDALRRAVEAQQQAGGLPLPNAPMPLGVMTQPGAFRLG